MRSQVTLLGHAYQLILLSAFLSLLFLANKWSRRLINWKSREIKKFLPHEFKVVKLGFVIHF